MHVSDQLLDLIRQRRTVRSFTGDRVSDEQIETLLELAMCAPTRLGREPWAFVVLRDPELHSRLAGELQVRSYLERAPVVIAVCGRPGLSPTWAMDVSAAIENILIGATATGLGAVWVGAPDTVLWDRCENLLRDELGIPQDVRIPALVAVGVPARVPEPHGRHDRFDLLKVHYGRWGQHQAGLEQA